MVGEQEEGHASVVATDATFAELVLDAEIPVVVDFWATWCGPCRMVAPVLEELAATYAGRVRVVKVDADENPQTVAAYGIASIPTLQVWRGGELVDTVVGARPKVALVQTFEAALAG